MIVNLVNFSYIVQAIWKKIQWINLIIKLRSFTLRDVKY